MRQSRPDDTVSTCAEGLRQHPDDPNLLCLSGQAFIALRRFDDAGKCIERALRKHPHFVPVIEVSGDLLLATGNPAQAIEAYREAKTRAPERTSLQAKIDKAKERLETAGSATDERSQAFFAAAIARAEQFRTDGEPAKAEKVYRDILQRDPNHPEALRLLAEIAAIHNQYQDAHTFLQRAVKYAPRYSRAWLDLAQVQQELGDYPAAIASARQLVALNPELGEPYVTLANAQGHANQHKEAIASYEAVLERAPTHPGAFSGLAHQLKTIGRQDEAVAVHRRNIAANPGNSEPYWNLANLKTFRFEDAEVEAMESILAGDGLQEAVIEQLNNALGLEYESRRDYPRAFSHFQRCNEVRRSREIYDPVAHEVQVGKIREVFNAEFLAEHAGLGDPDPAPIFIIGLPRSGSTLLEQVLASHSQVEGTHELSDLPHLVQSLNTRSGRGVHFPESLVTLEPARWSGLGTAYLQQTSKYRSGAAYFIDKNPNNFIYVGLLRLVLPNAKIINARRHPLDSCFGSYKQLFASGQPFSYDLMDIGEYYLLYDELMRHWHDVIPGAVLDVNYAEVVADLEGQVRRLLAYCDLPFEQGCVEFHRTERAVKTASSEQVRQPIYSSSVNLWRRYEPQLGDLIEVLEPLLRALPPEDRPDALN
ncbi:hypothetical protein BST95_16470 [Halioglobus japonicus]|uniref:Sulfotransferase family protein n=1 Tax=Halioglobus japonicus TaxID=930805 RepID=A0AAP8MGA2_9GAMM|nr:tetratricopeptide repeat-containing sulfotransferase family protein [Halioglobus japonicus]AQA19592.1 hypothetical protein BST95_16470 [Halioglobus japonicus]PLW87340.1 sulfotransferase family protein [Halioglobus japonicus]GHD08948.1 hypothetical protein GCM10007052_06510 [Halioglobus japonicus]